LADTRFPGEIRCVVAAGDVELRQDVGDVAADRLLAELQAACDRPVVESGGEQLEYLAFPVG
jgi:hypothetical protein